MASENSTGEESLQIQPQGDVEKELPQILGMDVQDDGVWGGRKAERKRKKRSEKEGRQYIWGGEQLHTFKSTRPTQFVTQASNHHFIWLPSIPLSCKLSYKQMPSWLNFEGRTDRENLFQQACEQ